MGRIIKVGKEYMLEFAYSKYLVDAVKANFPRRRFDWNGTKKWYIPEDEGNAIVSFAKRFNFEIMSTIEVEEEPDYTVRPLPQLQIDIPLKGKLFEYQKQGIQYAYEKKRCIIGDKPGLGKTLQSIGAVVAHDAFPCLVICPDDPGPTNWEREWTKWTGKKARVITPSLIKYLNRWVETDMIHVFVVGYSSLKKYFVEEIKRREGKKVELKDIVFNKRKDIFKSIIIDESHFCANFSTLRTKLVKGIAEGKEIIYELTGTSFVNRNQDISSQLAILNRLDDIRNKAVEIGIKVPNSPKTGRLVGGYRFFVDRYCQGDKQASRPMELNFLLNEVCFFSRNKEEVMTDLPPKTRQIIYCDIDAEHRQEYANAEADLANYLRQFKAADNEQVARALRGEAMVRIGICKNIAARGKLHGVKSFIKNAIDEGQKMVIFLHQHEVLHAMVNEFPDALTLTGLDEKADRFPSIDAFQNNPDKKLILVSMKVGGQLINLTASSHVGFIELGWNPATHDQCEDRCHRIGQKYNVLCSFFIARNTIDEWNYDLIETKRAISDQVTGGVSGDVETDIVENLANALLNKKYSEEVIE